MTRSALYATALCLHLTLPAPVAASAAAQERPHTVEEAQGLIGQGKYGDAEALCRQLLERESALHGEDSLEVAKVLDPLVHAMWRGGKGTSQETRAFAERAVSIKTKLFGPAHLETSVSLNGLALTYYFSNDLPQAIALARRVLEIREATLGPEDLQVASGAENVGVFTWRAGNFDEARGLYSRALAIREARLPPEHPLISQTLANLATLEQEAGNYEQSLPYFERALRIAEATLPPGHPQLAMTLSNMAGVLGELGRHADARVNLERALSLREQALGVNHPDVAETLSALGFLLAARLGLPEGLPLLQRSLSIYEAMEVPQPRQLAATLQNLAIAQFLNGGYAEAQAVFSRACPMSQSAFGADHPQYCACIDDHAELLAAMGDLEEAGSLRERALESRTRTLGEENPLVARTMMNLSMTRRELGDLKRARNLQERALAIQQTLLGARHSEVALSLENLGLLDEIEGNADGARRRYESALAIREEAFGADAVPLTPSLVSLARVLAAAGESEKAAALFARALSLQEKRFGPDHPSIAESLAGQAALLCKLGNRAAALDASLRAEAIGIEHLRLTARALPERAALRYAAVRQGGLDLALSILAAEPEPGAADVRRVWNAVARSRAAVLDEISSRHRLAGAQGHAQLGALAAEVGRSRTRLANLLVRGASDDRPDYADRLARARRDLDRAETGLAAKSAAFEADLARGRVEFSQIEARLPAGAALVSFVGFDQAPAGLRDSPVRLYAAMILRDTSQGPEFVPLGRATEIDAAVSAWQDETGHGVTPAADSSEPMEASRRTGEMLLRKVWAPIAPYLGAVRTVFIVPDGSLHLVNFAALPAGRSRYLIEEGPLVHYLSAERDLVTIDPMTHGNTGLLALGGPDYDAASVFSRLRGAEPGSAAVPAGGFRGERAGCGAFGTLRFQPLPATALEAAEVAATWSAGMPAFEAPEVITGVPASEASFRTKAPGRRILHLATHGFFLDDSCRSALESHRGVTGLVSPGPAAPQPASGPAAQPPAEPAVTRPDSPLALSGLALAGANHRSVAGPDEDDGILTAEEIGVMDLSGVEWAVLSACDTGVGLIRAGEGVLGLRRAFQVAGARTLIMSLWPVEDESARQWMKALYEARFLKHLSTVEAVRSAGLKVLAERRKRGLSAHPFFWAGFVAAGDWR